MLPNLRDLQADMKSGRALADSISAALGVEWHAPGVS